MRTNDRIYGSFCLQKCCFRNETFLHVKKRFKAKLNVCVTSHAAGGNAIPQSLIPWIRHCRLNINIAGNKTAYRLLRNLVSLCAPNVIL